ncbi:MAG: hypothetical protein ACR2MT_11580 [Aurantibacter sp.]
MGYNIEDRNYTIFSSNEKRTKFLATLFDFRNNIANSEELTLELEDEIFLQSVSYRNTFVLLSIKKKSSELCIYQFKNGQNYDKIKIDLSDQKFINNLGMEESLYQFLVDKSSSPFRSSNFKDLAFKKIDKTIPNPISITTHKNKLYVEDEKLIFSIDENEDITQILSLNLDDYTWSFESFEKPMIKFPAEQKKTNSFIFEDQLFTIASIDYGVIYTVRNLESKELIKEYRIVKDQEIPFRNTVMNQTTTFNRGFDDTNKFLKKINRYGVGTSVYTIGDKYEITFGGYRKPSSTPFVITSGVLFGALGAFIFYSNPNSLQFKGLFDKEFNHVKGELPQNVYDLVINFKENQEYDLLTEVIFKYSGDLIWGGYERKTRSYVLRRFSD